MLWRFVVRLVAPSRERSASSAPDCLAPTRIATGAWQPKTAKNIPLVGVDLPRLLESRRSGVLYCSDAVLNPDYHINMPVSEACVSFQAVVEAITPPPDPTQPGTVTISIPSAEDAYREICIENTLKNKDSGEVSLEPGAEVLVTIKAKATIR
jgi:hypothetical protein